MPTPHYGQPRYRVIAAELRERIESGVIPSGALLPTEGALTAEFRASRGTIRQAIAALRDDGLVATEHGRGTYVRPHHVAEGDSEASVTETRLRTVAADVELAKLFRVEVGTLILEKEIVKRSQDTVVTVIRRYRAPRA